ncbi:hypothetical protein ZWY2020_001429, partial [Hordeum vulgare]
IILDHRSYSSLRTSGWTSPLGEQTWEWDMDLLPKHPQLRRQMNLISKVFSVDKMNHAKTQGGPRGLHTWRSGKGLGCYQGDPNGLLQSPIHKTGYFSKTQEEEPDRGASHSACGPDAAKPSQVSSSSPDGVIIKLSIHCGIGVCHSLMPTRVIIRSVCMRPSMLSLIFPHLLAMDSDQGQHSVGTRSCRFLQLHSVGISSDRP